MLSLLAIIRLNVLHQTFPDPTYDVSHLPTVGTACRVPFGFALAYP